MKKVFLVFTTPNALDSTVSVDAPRLITTDPKRAIECARKIYTERTNIYIDRVAVYQLTMEREYELYDYLKEKSDENMVLIAWKKTNGDGWTEKFYNGFEEVVVEA